MTLTPDSDVRTTAAVPLLVLAAASVAMIPAFVLQPVEVDGAPAVAADGVVGAAAPTFLAWFVALPVACALLMATTRHQRGALPLVLGILGATLLLVPPTLLFPGVLPAELTARGMEPLLCVGLGLIAWAIVGRSPGLGVVAATYTGVVVLGALDGPRSLLDVMGAPVPEAAMMLPQVVLCAGILLVAGSIAALTGPLSPSEQMATVAAS